MVKMASAPAFWFFCRLSNEGPREEGLFEWPFSHLTAL